MQGSDREVRRAVPRRMLSCDFRPKPCGSEIRFSLVQSWAASYPCPVLYRPPPRPTVGSELGGAVLGPAMVRAAFRRTLDLNGSWPLSSRRVAVLVRSRAISQSSPSARRRTLAGYLPCSGPRRAGDCRRVEGGAPLVRNVPFRPADGDSVPRWRDLQSNCARSSCQPRLRGRWPRISTPPRRRPRLP